MPEDVAQGAAIHPITELCRPATHGIGLSKKGDEVLLMDSDRNDKSGALHKHCRGLKRPASIMGFAGVLALEGTALAQAPTPPPTGAEPPAPAPAAAPATPTPPPSAAEPPAPAAPPPSAV